MLQRKHFEFIAATIHAMSDKTSAEVAAHEFATACARENPRFDRARFLKACGADAENPGYGVQASIVGDGTFTFRKRPGCKH
jgi:hypothetical protein